MFTYWASWLCTDDRDGLMVLGHKLLLLACTADAVEREEEAEDHATPLSLALDYLPVCSTDTLEHAIPTPKDTISLKHLVWAVYDNLLVPGKSPSLSGYESYGQVLQHLLDNVFRGLHVRCLACTSALFK